MEYEKLNLTQKEPVEPFDYDKFIQIGTFFPLFILIIGVIGNLLAFLIIVFNKNLNKLSTMVYLAFIAFLNTLSLFHWNLDHFLDPNFHVKIVNTGIIACKLLTFIQYSSLQIVGLLHSLICVDLFFILGLKSNPYKATKMFTTRKTAVVWSLLVTLFISLVDLHFLMLNGYWVFEKEGNKNHTSENMTSKKSEFKCYNYPLNYGVLIDIWQHVVNVFYNYIPAATILIFSFLIICRLIRSNKSDKYLIRNKYYTYSIQMDQREIRNLSIGVLVISILFVIMTAPTQIMYTFWFDFSKPTKFNKMLSIVMDTILFLQHSSTFYICFLVLPKFRKATFSFFKCSS